LTESKPLYASKASVQKFLMFFDRKTITGVAGAFLIEFFKFFKKEDIWARLEDGRTFVFFEQKGGYDLPK
jgi:hypothetical protein